MKTTPAESPLRRRPLWRRLFSAQESGLVLVILLMMVVLTAFGYQTAEERILLDSPVQQRDGLFEAPGEDGKVERYAARDGWRTGEDSWGRPILLRRWTDYSFNRFLNSQNLVGIAKNASFIAVMAVAMAGIIVLGGIDLSIGSIYALAAVVGAMVLHCPPGEEGDACRAMAGLVSIPLGVMACCAVGAACGVVNGVATVGLRVHPFIITLGGMAIYRGLAFVLTKGQSIGDFPASFTHGGFKAQMFGVNPVPMFVMIAVGLAGAFVLQRTVFGRRTFAIGGNETAARYAGIPVGRVKIAWYAIGGALAGLSAAMLLGYYGTATSDAGQAYELRVIAAAVVGGASLSGGRGSALGAMLGAIVIQLIENGILVLNVDSNYTNIVIGLAIVVAVVVDQAKHRLTARGRAA